MAINNFKPFALDPNANVTSQADWEALPALLSGFTAGKASSAQVNKAIRQASFIAAALAQYTANKSRLDVLDDGDLNGFISKMGTAFGKDFQALDATLSALAGLATGANKLPYFTGNDTAAQTDLTSVGRDIIGKNTIADILTYLGLPELLDTKFDKTGGTIKATSDAINIQTEWSQSGYLRISGEDGRAIHQIGKIDAGTKLTLNNVAENAALVLSAAGVSFNGRKMGYLCEALNSGSGWWRDNDTGLLIQWGTTPAGTDVRWVLFPVPFVYFPHFAIHVSPSWYPGAEWGIADRTKAGMNAITTKPEQGGIYMVLGF
ncbi:phage tail protein [Enterobacter cloacae]|uniref:phage tail protein n=1 Tax=Enterobacter cloacae TaxID=550 RepID=UPI0033151D5E